MFERVYHFTTGLLWRTLLILLVGLAILVSTTTVLLSVLPSANQYLTEAVEERTGFRIDIGSLQGEMSGFRPKLKVSDLTISSGSFAEGSGETAQSGSLFEADELQIIVNPWRSLLQRQLILAEMKARDVKIPARLENAAGSIVIPIDPGVFASEIERLTLKNTKVMLLRDQGEDDDQLLLEVDLDLRRNGSLRELQLSASGDGNLSIDASGSGVGDLFDLRGFRGDISGRITASEIASMAAFFDLPISGEGDILFWTDASNGVFESTFQARGQVALQTENSFSDKIALSLIGVAESKGAEETWLDFGAIEVETDKSSLALENIHLGLFPDEWKVVMNDVDVSAAVSLVLGTGLVPSDTAEKLVVMRPSGQINALSLSGDYRQMGVQRATADIRNFELTENIPLPGVSNLSATVAYENGSGTIQVQSEDFSLSIPTQFEEPLTLGSVSAVGDFSITKDWIVIQDARVFSNAGDFIASGLLSGAFPLRVDPALMPEMDIVLGAQSAPSSRVLKFTPYKIDKEAYKWIQTSIGQGRAEQVAFVMRGGLRKIDRPLKSIQVSALADLETVKLMPGLPVARDVKGHVSVDNTLITFDLDSGEVGRLSVPKARVQVGKVGTIQLLETQADVQGSVPDAISEIASIPYVPERVGDALRRIRATGDMTAQFKLSLPIKGAPRVPEITTRGVIADTQFAYEGLSLSVNALSGDLVYQYPQGISGGTLTGTLFDDEITISLDPKKVDLGLESVGFSLSTQANLSARDLLSVMDFSVPKTVSSGTADFDIAMQAGSGVRLEVTSDLTGLKSGLPIPFTKPAALQTMSRFDLDLSAEPSLAFRYGEVFDGYAVRKLGGWSGIVRIGNELTNGPSIAATLPANRLRIDGKLTELDLPAWRDLITGGSSSNGMGAVSLEWQELQIDRLGIGIGELVDINTSGQFDGGELLVNVESDFITGDVNYVIADKSLNAIISAVDLDRLPSAVGGDTDYRNNPLDLDGDLPRIQVGVNKILRAGDNLGSISFEVDATSEAISLFDIEGVIDGVSFGDGNEIAWALGETQQTSMSINLQLGSASSTLSMFNADSVMDFASGNITSELFWEGSPLDISLRNVKGQANLRLNKGSFLPVSAQATGPLRFISIFNLAGLVQRANVNQLFDPGLTFDKATGDLTFDGERIVINEFAVRNGGGSLDLGGNFLTAQEAIDAELTVTLPLVENIPWVAALAGGLPIAAGAYLASRVFEDQVARLSSGVYSVSGPLSAPEVKFLRVFDARRSAEKMRSSEGNQTSDPDSASDRK